MLDRATLRPYSGVALLTVGSIVTLYGAYLLRGAFGNPFGSPTGFTLVNGLLNALPVFLLLCLPFVALYALLETRGHALTKWVGLTPNPSIPPLASGVLFGVLGVFWMFTRAGTLDRQAMKDETAARPKEALPFRAPGRESMETLVFVVVLVLVLQLFVVQAFVIPTGSMAETLYGYRKHITCPECQYEFEVNASDEVEPQGGASKDATVGYCCPNCRYTTKTAADGQNAESGDRLLVSKLMGVERGRVVVFKYPDAPQTGQTPQNYIKRLVGMPNETIALYGGDLYATTALTYPTTALGPDGKPLYPRPDDPLNAWRAPLDRNWNGPDYGYASVPEALDRFTKDQAAGFATKDGFQIIRKPDDLVMEMRRIVNSNDHQSDGLRKSGAPLRWTAEAGGGWAEDDPKGPKVFTHTGGGLGWVRYRHLLPPRTKDDKSPGDDKPPRDDARPGWEGTAPSQLVPRKITNFQGYNAGIQQQATRLPNGSDNWPGRHLDGSDHWAGDLLIDCTAEFTDPAATLVLELSKGEFRHRAEFANGKVRLVRYNASEPAPRPDGNKAPRLGTVPAGADEFTLGEAATGISGGKHKLRFGNVDCRLRVWVDDKPLDFGGKADYPPPPPRTEWEKGRYQDNEYSDDKKEGWTLANDIREPASVGAGGGVKVGHLELWRDTHYIPLDYGGGTRAKRNVPDGPVQTYFVQPGHYLCMGDNSAQSSDGRMWGLVPERLMLGRAVFIFFPFDRVGFIR